ncbi:MAG: TonB-dependent receptor, partial [Moraxellaceae bacterium]
RSIGIFVVEEITRNNWTYELGARGDFQSIEAIDDDKINHNSMNLSGTTTWHFTPNQQFIFGIAQSQRAPSIEELLANGPHPATGSYLIGDKNLDEETSTNIELGYHWHNDGIQTSINIFYNSIKDFIYARNLNEIIDDLNGYQYTQIDAIFKGMESEIKITFNTQWSGRIFADYVRATLENGSYLPRISPPRFGSSLDFDSGRWNANLSVINTAEQSHAGENESKTDSYMRIDARVGYTIKSDHAEYLVFLKGTNLLDEEIRNASSYLRDIAPEGGRGIQAGIRVTF